MAWLSPTQLQQIDDLAPASSYISLTKLPEGKEHRFRAFGPPISGYQGWAKNEKGETKPIRWEFKPDEIPPNLEEPKYGGDPLQYFVAGLFWDYTAEKFGIMQVTQQAVIKRFGAMQSDSDYGDPTEYDIKITRKVQNDRTTYDVMPSPPKPAAKSIQEAYENFYCDLSALYDGGDPFKDPSKD